jgi:hypothetical protein
VLLLLLIINTILLYDSITSYESLIFLIMMYRLEIVIKFINLVYMKVMSVRNFILIRLLVFYEVRKNLWRFLS